jgi:methyl-accepting chemotaxis protein WspA
MENHVLTLRNLLLSENVVRDRKESILLKDDANLERFVAQYDAAINTATDRKAFDKFKQALEQYESHQELIVEADAAADGDREDDIKTNTLLYPQFRNVVDTLDNLLNDNNKRGITAAVMADKQIGSLQISMLIIFSLALLVTLAASYYLLQAITRPLRRLSMSMDAMRQGDFTQRMEIDRHDEFGDLADGFNRMADEVMGLVGQVQKSGIRVSTSMTEIAATSKQQQATASEVAATTTQIGATSREISATSKELVRTMNEVSAVAEHAAVLAGSGQTGLSHMEETMGQVMEAAGSINAKLAVLNEKAGNINQVVTTITKVADQTNLLSLNAAIEAEKAGEYGRGFAVVSSEIRRLADQTAVATYDIEQMVKEIQSAVSAGVMGMDKFSEEVRRGMQDIHEVGGKLSEIIAQVQALVPRFETVNEGMQAQATGAEQISEALVQLTEATQQTVESLRQSTSAIDDLNQVSGSMHGSISRFKLVAA